MEPILHVRLPDEYERGQVDDLLVGKFAFLVESPIAEKWRFYDTFDWRLFNRSLALRQTGQELSLEPLSSGESLSGLSSGLTSASNIGYASIAIAVIVGAVAIYMARRET